MRAPETFDERRVATFVDAYPGHDIETIARGLAMSRVQTVYAMLPLATGGVIRGELERYYATGAWDPEAN